MTTTVYFCWLCGKECTDFFSDRHYDQPERKINFCTENHLLEYKELKNL